MQSSGAIALGTECGFTNQGSYSVAIGTECGFTNQGIYSVAIGYQAGQTGQGDYSISIGYQAGNYNQSARSIILNADNTELNAPNKAFYVHPIRNQNLTNALVYNTLTYEISYATTGTKTFVIDHPNDKNKYLVHACLEGPESGVYYRGKGEIINNSSVNVKLPDYVSKFATDLSVQITPIYNDKVKIYNLSVSEIQNNFFTVHGNNCKFFWTVYGNRNNIEVEPNKKDVNVKGDGPYKWI